jgi:tetratricopeptide (TPR) repeat protein
VGNETHAKFIDLLRGTGTITDGDADELRAADVDIDDAASIAVARGWAPERSVAQCVSTFERVQVVSLAESTLDLRALAGLSESDAIGERVLPLVFDETTLTLATTTKPTEGDLQRWGERFGRKIVPLRAIGAVVQKLIPYAYLAREHGATTLRGRLSTHDAPTATTLRPANASATIELAGVMNNLGNAFNALRAFARADTSRPLPAPAPAAPAPAPAAQPLTSASTIQSSAFQRTATGSFAAPRIGAADASKATTSTTPRTSSGSMAGVGVAAAAHVAVPLVASGVDPAPLGVRAASPAFLVAVHDDIGAALATALRADGATVFEAVDVPRLRAMLRSTKPAVVVVDVDLPGGNDVDDAVSIVRAAPGNRDVALLAVAARELPVARFNALHEVIDASVVLDGTDLAVDLLRAAVAPFLGRPVPGFTRPATRSLDIGALRSSFAWLRSPGEYEEVLGRLDAHLAGDAWDAEAHALRATVLLQLKRANEALRAWERATTLDPARGDTWVELATHLDRIGLTRKAERAWRRAADVVTDEAMRRRIGERLKV